MEFLDHTGHIFSLPSYTDYPTGYEYDEHPYIFWINESGKLSINNYYIKPIRIVFPSNYEFNENTHLSIKMESNSFALLSSLKVQSLLNESKNIFEYISLNQSELLQELTEDDVIVLTDLEEDEESYSMITFYVICNCDNASTLLTNILITYNSGDSYEYCPITVGGEFIDANEMLIINGRNMGIDLPKDIVKAVYNSSFYNDVNDNYLYNSKLKELILNYMNIKGECGNYKSVINSLNWFGWGDKLKISKLIQTDNNFIEQYIIDKFDINNDLLYSYQQFKNSTYIKLSLNGTIETDNYNLQKFNDDFWGEGKPIVENIIDASTIKQYDECDIDFHKPYYDFLFTELGLKLSILEYYYKKFFLPIHIFIHNTSISYQSFINDTKHIICFNKEIITEKPQVLEQPVKTIITFPEKNYIMLNTQHHYVDEQFNEFNRYIYKAQDLADNGVDLFWVDENCLSIPIRFEQVDSNGNELEDQYYDCTLILDKLTKTVYNYIYTFDFIFTYNEILTLNISDKFGEASNNIVISHILWEPNFDNQKFVITNNWSDYMSLNDFKQYIRTHYFEALPFGADLPSFTIRIKSINYLNSIRTNGFDYTKYANCEVIDDNHQLIYESKFRFTQKSKKYLTYYKNFVIIPKMFGKQYDINFWLNNEFNIYLNVNNKWYTYNFICKLPEFQLELGKLQYKYYLDVNNDYINQHGDVSLFTQLNDLTIDSLSFNYFMWQPDLVRVNNIDFFDNLMDYYVTYKYNITLDNDKLNIKTIEGNDKDLTNIQLNDFYYIVTFNNQKFYIHNNVISDYLIKELHKEKNPKPYIKMHLSKLSEENRNLDWLMTYTDNDDISFTAVYNEYKDDLSRSDVYSGSSGSRNDKDIDNKDNINELENILITNEDGTNLKFKTLKNQLVDIGIINTNDDDNYIIVYEDEYTDNKEYIIIYFELDRNNCVKFYIKTASHNNVYLDVKQSVYRSADKLLSKYKEFPNIVNNYKYLNKIHLYDIYKNGDILLYKHNIKSKLDYINSDIELKSLDDEEYKQLVLEDFKKLGYEISSKEQYINEINEAFTKFGYDISIDNLFTDKTYIDIIKQRKQNVVNLYNIFFYTNDLHHVESNIIIPQAKFTYDFYLMHDNYQWYSLFISRLTENKYLKDELIINEDNKELEYSVDTTKIYPVIEKDGDITRVNYYNINKAIINNILLKNKLYIDDLVIMFDNSIVNIDSNTDIELLTTMLKYQKIQKIFNKNIGAITDDYEVETDIEWNVNTENTIGQNWFNLDSLFDGYLCTNCGSNKINIEYAVDSNGNTLFDKVIITCEECGNRQEVNIDNSVIEWYDANGLNNTKYKLVYKLSDDIYSSVNPNGNYHLTINQPEQYKFSLNNKLYFITKNNNDNNFYLDGTNSKVDIIEEHYGYDKSNAVYYENRDTSVLEGIYNKVDNEIHNYDIIAGLPSNDTRYYIDLDTIVIYNKYIADLTEYELSEFYLLYDGNNIYKNAWYMVIETEVLNDIIDIHSKIKIYSAETKAELKWIINPKYNFNAGSKPSEYRYYIDSEYIKYLNNEKANNIKFNENTPDINIYMDDEGFFFTLVFNSEHKILEKQYIYRIKNENDVSHTLWDLEKGCSVSKNDYHVLLNTKAGRDEWNKKWGSTFEEVLGPIIASLPEYDGLWYYINESYIHILLYIGEPLNNEISKWCYIINGEEFEYTGPVEQWKHDSNGNKLNEKVDILPINNIVITLSDLGLPPIRVEVSKIDKNISDDYYNAIDTYLFKYIKSDDKFLINRMEYVPTNGVNHFNTNDIIVASLSHKMNKGDVTFKTEYKFDFGVKWIFEPISLKMKKTATVDSTTELGIMSIGDSNIKYETGFYNLKCSYSIDGNTQNIYTKKARILIK